MAQCQPQQWTVVSDFDRITGAYRRSNIQLILQNVTAGTHKGKIMHGHNRKKLQQLLKIVTAAVFFRNKKSPNPYLQTRVVSITFEQFSWLAPHQLLCGLLRGSSNDRLSPCTAASTHTVAVPSGIHTRFPILLWGCNRVHRHSNGIFTFAYMIHDYNIFVNASRCKASVQTSA